MARLASQCKVEKIGNVELDSLRTDCSALSLAIGEALKANGTNKV